MCEPYRDVITAALIRGCNRPGRRTYGGNGGCLSLAAKATYLKAALQTLLKPEDK